MLSRIVDNGEEESINGIWAILTEDYLSNKHKGIGENSVEDLMKVFARVINMCVEENIRLLERFSNLLSYVTYIGQFRPITLPEGVRTAPQPFSQMMYKLLRTKHKFGKELEYYFDKNLSLIHI